MPDRGPGADGRSEEDGEEQRGVDGRPAGTRTDTETRTDEGTRRKRDSPTPEQVHGIELAEDAARQTTAEESTGDDAAELSAGEYVERVRELAGTDPIAAGDRIGDLLAIARTADPEVREAVSDALDAIGERRPQEFVIWADDLLAFAREDDPKLAYVGLRSLAQLASRNEKAASKGLLPAVRRVDGEQTEVRTAALALIAEVGPEVIEAVGEADRSIAAALSAEEPAVRMAAAMAAGNLLGTDPQHFPRTATALLETLDDPAEEVRTYAHVALAHFASEHPAVVPEKERAVRALEEVDDAELGVRQGTTAEALVALLKVEAGY